MGLVLIPDKGCSEGLTLIRRSLPRGFSLLQVPACTIITLVIKEIAIFSTCIFSDLISLVRPRVIIVKNLPSCGIALELNPFFGTLGGIFSVSDGTPVTITFMILF